MIIIVSGGYFFAFSIINSGRTTANSENNILAFDFTFEILPLTLTSYDVKRGESLAVVDAAMVDKFTADSSWNTSYDDFTKYFCKLQNNRYIYTQCAECLQRARQAMKDKPGDVETANYLIQKKREMDKNTDNFRNFLCGFNGFTM